MSERPPGAQVGQESAESPRFKYIKVFRVRHGETAYREQFAPGNETVEADLTEEGVETIGRSAQLIAEQLNKNDDVIFVATSPRVRAKQSAEIIKQHLAAEGFTVLNEGVHAGRTEQARAASTEVLDQEGVPISSESAEYRDKLRALLGMSEDAEEPDPEAVRDLRERHLVGEVPELESLESVDQRSRDQLAYAVRIARLLQKNAEKRIVLIQVEHEETMDEFLRTASGGSRSMRQDSGPEKGEVLQLTIPTTDAPIEATSLQHPETSFEIDFDHLGRTFNKE